MNNKISPTPLIDLYTADERREKLFKELQKSDANKEADRLKYAYALSTYNAYVLSKYAKIFTSVKIKDMIKEMDEAIDYIHSKL